MSRASDRGRGGGRGRGDVSLPIRSAGAGGGQGDRGRGFDGGRGGGGRGRGGGAPAQVEAFSQGSNHPAVVDAEVTRVENETEKSIKSSRQTQVEFPLRPGYGTIGKAVVLWANYFRFVSDDNMILYRYHMELRPQGHPRVPVGKMAKRVVQLFLEEHFLPDSKDIATDFRSNLICRHEIDVDEAGYTITYRAEEEEEPAANAKQYRVHLQFTGTYTTTELINHLTLSQAGSVLQSKEELIQALNIIVGHYPKASHAIANVGSNRHFSRDAQDSMTLGGGLRAIRGFLVSVRAVTARLLVNVQVKNFAVYDYGRLDAVIQAWRTQNDPNPYNLAKFLSKLSVSLTHLERKSKSGRSIPRIKKIAGLATPSDGRNLEKPPVVPKFGANAQEVKFFLNSEEASSAPSKATAGSGKKGQKAPKVGPAQAQQDQYISVYDYFQQTYNITIQVPQLPVINVGTRDKPSYLPVQVCEVMPGQPANVKLSPQQTQSMIKFAVRKPVENARSIVSSGGELLGFEPTNETLGAFDISARPKLVAVPGRVLPHPKVKYSGSSETNPQYGSWNMRDVQFVTKTIMPSWTFLRISIQGNRSPWPTDEAFLGSVNELRSVLRKQGIEAAQFVPGRHLVIPPQNFEQQIDDAIHGFVSHPTRARPGMLFVVIPEKNNAPVYNRIKFACDVKEGLLNVCVLDNKFSRNSVQYCANVGLKFNLKLGGRNHSIETSKMGIISEKKTMVVGIDVTHPSPGSASNAPSVAGMVASVDEWLGQWPADLRIQTARQEMVDDLDGMLKSRLKLWQSKHKTLPENILVYRDGVSEGQYNLVLEQELPKLRQACEEMYPATMTKANKPRITIIIVGKRHNTRFYPTKQEDADRSGNPQNGTIVDRGVTEARNWDFFLQAHTALQGTARPAHYYIVYDQIMREQKLQPGFKSAADALENLTHNMCYLFGRATKAVSICPPAYYADLVCERARLYLKEYFEPGSTAESTSGASTASLPDASFVTIHGRIRDSMFYI